MSDPQEDNPSKPNDIVRPGLARAAEKGLQHDLDVLINDRMLARADVGNSIALDLDANAGLALPTLGDIQQMPDTPGSPGLQSLEQIEALLSIDKLADLASAGNRLNDLLDGGAATLEERNILRRGILLMRGRLYREAAEWWQLNTPAGKGPFAILLQVLLAITFRLQGDTERATSMLANLKPDLDRLSVSDGPAGIKKS